MILQAVAGACSIFLGGLSVRQGDTINKKHSTHLSHARSNSTAAACVAGLVPVLAMKLSSCSGVCLRRQILDLEQETS